VRADRDVCVLSQGPTRRICARIVEVAGGPPPTQSQFISDRQSGIMHEKAHDRAVLIPPHLGCGYVVYSCVSKGRCTDLQ
jgi:hypothetical protein